MGLDPVDGVLWWDGARVEVDAAFVRHDVFAWLGDHRPEVAARAEAFHGLVTGWLATNPGIRWMNRGATPMNKAADLARAHRWGLRPPTTRVSTEAGWIEGRDLEETVVKPLMGGGPCRRLGEIWAETPLRSGATARPAIVQPRLPGRELRVYLVGAARIGLWIHSEAVDHREDASAQIRPALVLPEEIGPPLEELRRELGLDFAAADFKEDEAGRLRFLEINRQPMFAGFDQPAGGAIAEAILDELARSMAGCGT